MSALYDFLNLFWFSWSSDSFSAFLWCLFIAITMGILTAAIISKFNAKSIRIMKDNEAFSPESAIEIPDFHNKNVRYCDMCETFGKRKYYISEKKLKKAEFIENMAKTKWKTVILSVILTYVVILILHKYVPMYIDNINDYFR